MSMRVCVWCFSLFLYNFVPRNGIYILVSLIPYYCDCCVVTIDRGCESVEELSCLRIYLHIHTQHSTQTCAWAKMKIKLRKENSIVWNSTIKNSNFSIKPMVVYMGSIVFTMRWILFNNELSFMSNRTTLTLPSSSNLHIGTIYRFSFEKYRNTNRWPLKYLLWFEEVVTIRFVIKGIFVKQYVLRLNIKWI